MVSIILTQYDGKILGPIAFILGKLMNLIFIVLDKIGIPNIGLSIVLFTIVIYLLLMPLTIKQQKFSKLSAKMNPEIQAIQAKYKNKKDNESMMRMNEETKAVYEKYGTSPTGSCLQLLIQMPILFALYRVIYAIPAYVNKVGDTFGVLADKIISSDSAAFLKSADLSTVTKAMMTYGKNLDNNLKNGVIDVLYNLSSSDLKEIVNHYSLSDVTFNGLDVISKYSENGKLISKGLIDTYNTFLGINIANSPQSMFTEAMATKHYGLIVAAIMIPFLAAFTQWVNTKLMPQVEQTSGNDQQSSIQASMKTMNVMMPLMSAFFCFSFPSGMGIYWIAGSVVRSIQQIVINKHIDKIDFDALIEKNVEKAKKKREKYNVPSSTIKNSASMSTKAMVEGRKSTKSLAEKEEAIKKATEYYSKGTKPGSIAAKANMVKQYNEKNNK